MTIISSLIPPGVTACVAGANYNSGLFYMLLKNGKLVIVRTESAYKSFPPTDYKGFAQITRAYNRGLELIQAAVDKLKFDESNWAYLKVEGRSVWFDYTEGPLCEDVCIPWVRVIDEKEITITKWLYICEWRGLWEGKEVDLKMAWDQVSALRVRRMSEGYKVMQGLKKMQILDLTFDVLGHVSRDGKIVGIVTECARGRPVQAQDRALVYQAIVQLYENRILFHLPDPMSSILITDDSKVRFLDPFQVEIYSHDDEVAFSQMLQKHCWDKLHNLFEILEQGNALAPRSYHHAIPNLEVVGNPSPARPLPESRLFRLILTLGVFSDERRDQCARDTQRQERNHRNSREQFSRVERIQRSPCLLWIPAGVSPETLDLVSDDGDLPLGPTNPRISGLPSSYVQYMSLDWWLDGPPYNPPKKPRCRSQSPYSRNVRRRAEGHLIGQSM